MSGIAGIIPFGDALLEPGLIKKITGAMAHRGPHGIHHWIKGGIALGHSMLRTTPESLHEKQPVTSEDESLILVMDGRIDNREDILRELQACGIKLRNKTDSELLLGTYRLWGEDCPRHLLGDFAFAIWNAKRSELFCARDCFGVKPFFYVITKDYFAFASDEEALLGLPGVSNEPDSLKLAYGFVVANEGYNFHTSWLRDIQTLRAASSLRVQHDGQSAGNTYWELKPMEESQFASDDECEEAFSAVFEEAVRCRLRTLDNPALMLSGGIDSASVAGIARRCLRDKPQQLQTFSTVSDNPSQCSETRNILSITKGHEEHAHFLSLPSFHGSVSQADLKQAAWNNAHPVANSILLPIMIYLAAARLGNRVMFDGVLGDVITFTPNRGAIADQLRSSGWRAAWSEARKSSTTHTYLQRHTPLVLLAKSAWDTYMPYGIKRFKRSIFSILQGGPLKDSLINPDFAKRLDLVERIRDYQRHAAAVSHMGGQHELIHVLTQPEISYTLEGFNQAAARYGVDPRHPWSDKRLVEFYFRLPLRQKTRNGWTKYLLRKTMAQSLRSDICWYSEKTHLGGQLVRSFLNHNHEEIRTTLQMSKDTLSEYVEPGRLESLLKQFEEGTDLNDPDSIHTMLVIALWLRRINTL